MKNVFLKIKFVRYETWYQASKARMLATVLPIFFAVGCSHAPISVPKCSGVSFHSPTEIDACIEESGIKVGDRVTFLKPNCSNPDRLKHQHQCSNIKIGKGSVIKILDEHLSTINLDSPFEITETTILELEK